MDDVVINVTDPDTLLAEVRRLRAEIAQLHERVELLDRLAYQDVLIDLPNRRGFMRQLEAAIDRVTRYDDSAATTWAIGSVDVFLLLRTILGWSSEQYADWLRQTLTDQLLTEER